MAVLKVRNKSGFPPNLLPILYGPYFAYEAEQFRVGLFFVMPVLFAFILVGLSNIQDDLENPFDQTGEDDVAIDSGSFVTTLDFELKRLQGNN